MSLALQKYADNIKKALLTDNTIMLWNDRCAHLLGLHARTGQDQLARAVPLVLFVNTYEPMAGTDLQPVLLALYRRAAVCCIQLYAA